MRTMQALWLMLGMAGCADMAEESPTTNGVLRADRGDVGALSGTIFTCAKTSASAVTPCDDQGFPTQGSQLLHPSPGVVRVEMTRSTRVGVPGAVVATIDLSLDSVGTLSAIGQQYERTNGTIPGPVELARDGSVTALDIPSNVDTDGRNAGWFSMTFSWGTMSGTYDSDDRPPQ